MSDPTIPPSVDDSASEHTPFTWADEAVAQLRACAEAAGALALVQDAPPAAFRFVLRAALDQARRTEHVLRRAIDDSFEREEQA